MLSASSHQSVLWLCIRKARSTQGIEGCMVGVVVGNRSDNKKVAKQMLGWELGELLSGIDIDSSFAKLNVAWDTRSLADASEFDKNIPFAELE
jgi:hypothetical protein